MNRKHEILRKIQKQYVAHLTKVQNRMELPSHPSFYNVVKDIAYAEEHKRIHNQLLQIDMGFAFDKSNRTRLGLPPRMAILSWKRPKLNGIGFNKHIVQTRPRTSGKTQMVLNLAKELNVEVVHHVAN